jgi:hypothetical protein
MYCGPVPKNELVQKNQPAQQHPSSIIHPLIAALWGADDGHHFIATQDPRTSAFHTHPVANAEVATRLASESSANGLNVFHACSTYGTDEKRTAENVASIASFWLDIDCGKLKAESGQGYTTQEEASKAVSEFCRATGLPMPNFQLNSGNGLHAYWILTKDIGGKLWKEFAAKFKELTKALGLKADPSRTADPASLMRFPGTLNLKGEKPLPVELIGTPSESIPAQQMLDAIGAAHDRFCGNAGKQNRAFSNAAEEFSGVFTQAEFDRLKSALTVLDPDCDEHTWKFHRLAILANLARLHPEWADRLCLLARNWSSGELAGKPSRAWTTPGNSNGRTGKDIFADTWERFFNKLHSGERATVGTIYFHAKEAGWVYQSYCPSASSSLALATRNAENFEVVDAPVPKMAPLQVVQQQYCLINIDGRLWTLNLRTHNSNSSEGTASKLVVSNLKDGALLVRRELRSLGVDGDESFKLSSEFFNNPKTTCYDGVEFNPVGSSGNYLNLWVGPTLVPKASGWTLIRAFVLEIICNNDSVAFEYLIQFLAHALQRPAEKPGIMVILLGGQGIGKGTLGKILRLIWSATYWHIHKIDDVTGNFNAALERAFIVFLDEALFVGDRKASDALKSLVTEPIIQINEKYQPARQTRSYHRFFAATNAEHFKNTERDDRRDFVLKVSEDKKDDHAYWSSLNNEIEHGGTAAMMHDLVAMDLSGFNVRAKPSTAALVEQKILSLGPVERWWFSALNQKYVEGTDDWPDFISTTGLIAAVMEFSGGKVYRKPSPIEVIKTMKQLCPSVTNKQQQESLGRHRGLALPGIEQARREFERYIGGAVIWESDEAS